MMNPTTSSAKGAPPTRTPRTASVAHALLAVLLGVPVGQSFAPPSILTAARHNHHHHHRRVLGGEFAHGSVGGGRVRLRAGGGGAGEPHACDAEGGEGTGAGAGAGWGWRRAARRRSTSLRAEKKRQAPGDELLNVKNVGASLSDDDKIQAGGEEEMRRLMFDLDPDDENQGPMYFGKDGKDGPEREWVKEPEEMRFAECYLAFCMDREDAPGEEKNYPFWGVRQPTYMEHLKWARIMARTLEQDPDREAAILWNRSILSPSKFKVVGSMICVWADSKAAAVRLLEDDPFRKAGLFASVSMYRYPYSQEGEHSWQLRAYPYMALCMDRKKQAQLRKDTRPSHLEYLQKTRRVITAGPIFDPTVAADDPKAAPMGSVVFFNADNDEHARETTDNDPYNVAGLFESVFIARFTELDLDGLHQVRPWPHDPLREVIAKEGLGVKRDYIETTEYKPFDSLKWLEAENAKKEKQIYMEHRRDLYERRDVRLERDRVNQEVEFQSGAYVYMGSRNETEWYDHWPTKAGGADEYGTGLSTLYNSYPPVDVFSDDLN